MEDISISRWLLGLLLIVFLIHLAGNLQEFISDLVFNKTLTFEKIAIVLMTNYKSSIDDQFIEYINEFLPNLTNKGFEVECLGIMNSLPKKEGRALLIVEYSKEVGARYVPKGKPVSDFLNSVYATDIFVRLKIIHPTTNRIIWEDSFYAKNSETVKASALFPFFEFEKDLLVNVRLLLKSKFEKISMDLDKYAPKDNKK